jgi:hypothetical protein
VIIPLNDHKGVFNLICETSNAKIPPHTRMATGAERMCGQNSSKTLARLDGFRDNQPLSSQTMTVKYFITESNYPQTCTRAD